MPAAAVLAQASCLFSFWSPGAVDPLTGALVAPSGCRSVDLSALPTKVFTIHDSYPDAYSVTSPCAVVPGCPSPAVQNPSAGAPCGIELGLANRTSVTPLPLGESGVRLTLSGGADRPGCPGGRTLAYDFVCNASAPLANPPEPTVTVDSGCKYVVTWQHPSACTSAPAPPSSSCEPTSLPTPTAPQLRYQTGEIVALTHFNMASFVKNGDPGCDASNWLVTAPGASGPSGDPATFNPTQLDTDQWADVYAAVGVKGAVLTAKHGCGHLLWPTNVTLPDGSPYAFGVGKAKSAIKTDVLRSFSNSMIKANITHGFYYSFTNNFYLNAGASKNVIPGQVNVSQSEFESIALAQVSELWSNYGSLGEIWFDGGYGGNLQPTISKMLLKQPDAVGFGGLGVTPNPVGWVGTESGMPGGDELWSTGTAAHGDPTSTQWLPKCCDTTLQVGDTWFFEPGLGVRPLSELITVYHQTVGRNGVLEMDFAIDRTGRVAPTHEARYREFGAWITSCYGQPVAAAPAGPGGDVNVSLPAGATIDRVIVREDQSKGQRIRAFTVEVLRGGAWVALVNGTGVGNKFIGVAPQAVTAATAARLRVTAAVAEPMLLEFAVFRPCPTA